MASVLYLSEML